MDIEEYANSSMEDWPRLKIWTNWQLLISPLSHQSKPTPASETPPTPSCQVWSVLGLRACFLQRLQESQVCHQACRLHFTQQGRHFHRYQSCPWGGILQTEQGRVHPGLDQEAQLQLLKHLIRIYRVHIVWPKKLSATWLVWSKLRSSRQGLLLRKQLTLLTSVPLLGAVLPAEEEE